MICPTTSPTLVTFRPAHLDDAVQLSQQLNWPHRREDWQLNLSLSKGFALINEQRVVGTAFAALFGVDVAALHMIIVEQSLRGRGAGSRLMQAIMEATDGREQHLIATADGLNLYHRSGFEITGRILQHQGTLAEVTDPETAQWCDIDDRDSIVGLDTAANAMQRAQLIDALIVTGRIAVLRENNAIIGFAALRQFGLGEVAGPVVASSYEDAKSLLSFLFSQRTGVFMRVDFDEQTGLADWLQSIGLCEVGSGHRMTRNARPRSQRHALSTYALASQALG